MASTLQNYSALVERVFGPVTTFDAGRYTTNNVVGALASADYREFQANFEARLRRLNQVYSDDDSSRSALIVQVNQIADPKNWEGAFAELSALDFFTSSEFAPPPSLDVNVDGTRAFMRQFGHAGPANLDLHWNFYDVFSDVKCLKDNVAEIVEGIFQQIWPAGRPCLVRHESRLDDGFEQIQRNRTQVLAELRSALVDGNRPNAVYSQVVDELVFRFAWDRSVLVTEGSYTPFRHASELHRLPFQHAKKFIGDRPFFLTFVVFPWFNNIVTGFGDANKVLYRSLARRVFCQYRGDRTKMVDWFPRFVGGETIWEVSRALAGVMFIEDRTITSNAANQANVRGYFYQNPNAELPMALFRDYLHSLDLAEVDDFVWDNY